MLKASSYQQRKTFIRGSLPASVLIQCKPLTVAAATLGSGMPPPSRKALFVSSLLKSFYAIEGSEIKEW